MSASDSKLAENSTYRCGEKRALEIFGLSPRWHHGLRTFLQALIKVGDTRFFSPHPMDDEAVRQLSCYAGKDLYYILVEGESVVGYGLLRGWDEGYQIPSLGIAIHPSARGSGLGTVLMNFLHAEARKKGADKVRLRVRKENQIAIAMYNQLGYVFETDMNQTDFFVGHKELGIAPDQ